MILRGGRVIDPANNKDGIGDVRLDGATVAEVRDGADGPITPQDGERVVDCAGLVVCPGLIDIHVHLREPGLEYKETIETGARAASRGGFTAVACMPNTNPVIDNAAIVRDLRAKSDAAGAARVHIIGALAKGMANRELSEMADLKDAGIVAASDDAYAVQDAEFLRRAMEYAQMLGLPVLTHCENAALSHEGAMNEGYTASVMGVRGLPREAYEMDVARNILLSLLTGAHLHVLHVSTAREAELIRWGKAQGAPVTCETAPHYWCLTDEACRGYDTNAKMNPPLRTPDDCEAMIAALADGTIDCIATDHAPHAAYEKQVEFASAPFGIVGLETSLALGVTHLVQTGRLSLSDLVRLMSVAPAQILNLPGGSLAPGSPADVTVFDPDAVWTVDPARFASKGRNTPFAGHKLTGLPRLTIVGGEIVYDAASEAA